MSINDAFTNKIHCFCLQSFSKQKCFLFCTLENLFIIPFWIRCHYTDNEYLCTQTYRVTWLDVAWNIVNKGMKQMINIFRMQVNSWKKKAYNTERVMTSNVDVHSIQWNE